VEPRCGVCEFIPVTVTYVAVRVNWLRCTNDNTRPTFGLSVAGRRLSSLGRFVLWVTGGMHGCQRNSVRKGSFALAEGMTSTETDNSLGFVASDTSIDGLRDDDTR
jgi:hypothetical protein